MKKFIPSKPVVLILLLILGVTSSIGLSHGWMKSPDATGVLPPPQAAPAAATPGILDRPIISNPPTQLEEGSLIFWGVCMACHGNRGQGLTDEWREAAFGEDKDCWASKCHASNHPPQGFVFPREVPALVGGGRLGRFSSAQQLYDYIVAMMPWWNPASLTAEKGWQVTAYILEMNDTLPGQIGLDGRVASAVPVHRKLQIPANDTAFALILAGTLALLLFGFVWHESIQPRSFVPSSGPELAERPSRQRPGFLSHLHPPRIPAEQARLRYTLGAGGLAVLLCIILLVTGLLEMFYYIPTPEKAAITVETLSYFVPLGALVRNLHYWTAQFLVLVGGIHLLRVVFTGAYSAPRRFNFLLGMGMFVLIILLDFTGYVLRWDEGIRWALIAGTNLLRSIPWAGAAFYGFVVGSAQVGPATLIRFYAWHIFALGSAAAFLLIWHIFRVRRDGGIATPAPQFTANEMTSPSPISRSQLLSREVLFGLICVIFLLLLAALRAAPLSPPLQGDSTLATDTHAPWFFLWVQQLLKLGDPFLLGVLLPIGVILLVSALPYLTPGLQRVELGRWFPHRGRAVQIIVAILAITILALTLLALLPIPNE